MCVINASYKVKMYKKKKSVSLHCSQDDDSNSPRLKVPILAQVHVFNPCENIPLTQLVFFYMILKVVKLYFNNFC